MGKFTYPSTIAASVVDYILTLQGDISTIGSITVEICYVFNGHCPLFIGIVCKRVITTHRAVNKCNTVIGKIDNIDSDVQPNVKIDLFTDISTPRLGQFVNIKL